GWRNTHRPRPRPRSPRRLRSAPARPGARAASGRAGPRADWPSAPGPCGRRGGCRTRSRARRGPSAAPCAARGGHRAWRWPAASPCGRVRRRPGPRRTGCRRSAALRRTGRAWIGCSAFPTGWGAREARPCPRYRARMATPMHMPTGLDPGLVAAILDEALATGARVLGISGLQGSGKSTLAARLAAEGARRGLRCAVLSIDDVYLPRDRRGRLARDVHPLLATRGPPGTHRVGLALEVLDALREGRRTALPRFDKLADAPLPRRLWPRVDGADLVLFEGWFLGTPAETDAALATPLNALERDEDGDGRWRRWCNDALARDYPA